MSAPSRAGRLKRQTGATIVRALFRQDPLMTTLRIFASLSTLLFLAACASGGDAPPPAVESAPAAPAAPAYALSDIQGTGPAAIDALLGAPALTRKEGDGEFRRYRLSECTLIIILYPDETGAQRATHVEATALSSGREKPDLDACLAAG